MSDSSLFHKMIFFVTIIPTYKNTVGYVECISIWSKCTEHMAKQAGKHTEESNCTITIPWDQLWEYQAWKAMSEMPKCLSKYDITACDSQAYTSKRHILIEVLPVPNAPCCALTHEYMHHQIWYTHWGQEVPQWVYAFWKCKPVIYAPLINRGVLEW